MRRFFFDPIRETGDQILITGSEARHISTVLRMQPGMEVELFDGSGAIIQGEILQVSSQEALIHVRSRRTQHDSATPLTLALAMLKGKKMDFLIQKATELGVHTFIPLITRYCEKKVHGKQQLDRWQRIILEACKQCRRPIPMRIKKPLSIECLSLPENSNLIMGWEDEDSRPLSPALLRDNHPTLLLIGPEGGFHPDEVSRARDQGFCTVSLGPRILRAETAALAAVAIIQYLNNSLEPHRRDAEKSCDSR
ncbi:MAG: 16S rRNA (uracil(1498)-N(3))-methyltransferase [Deltaproteobacteria bacterium]|nr:16S rRNA (uracil(1498)-N(3))-methyltransferase [Deltaproteobacteria bacterium]